MMCELCGADGERTTNGFLPTAWYSKHLKCVLEEGRNTRVCGSCALEIFAQLPPSLERPECDACGEHVSKFYCSVSCMEADWGCECEHESDEPSCSECGTDGYILCNSCASDEWGGSATCEACGRPGANYCEDHASPCSQCGREMRTEDVLCDNCRPSTANKADEPIVEDSQYIYNDGVIVRFTD